VAVIPAVITLEVICDTWISVGKFLARD